VMNAPVVSMVDSEETHDIDPAAPGLLGAMWRFRWAVVLGTLCAALLGWTLSSLQPVRYVATARLLFAEPPEAGDPERRLINTVMLINSPRVQARAAELSQGRFSAEEIETRAIAEAPNTNTHDLLLITGSDQTADGAAAVANAVAEAFQLAVIEQQRATVEQATTLLAQYRSELENTIAQADQQLQNARAAAEQTLRATPFVGAGQRLQAVESMLSADPANERLEQQRNSAVAQLAELQTSMQEVTMNAALYGSGVTMLRPAEPPAAPVQPRPERDAALAAATGLAAAAAVAWRHADRQRLVTGERDVVALLRAPLLGVMRARRSWSWRAIRGGVPLTEAPRFVADSLQFLLARERSAVVVLTSPEEGRARSWASLQIAAAACLDSSRVLLVDCDLRARELTGILHAEGQPGLTSLADPDIALADCTREIVIAGERRLPFLPAGPSDTPATDFFRSRGLPEVVARIRERATLAVMDAPPVLDSTDAPALAAESDGIVVVVEPGVSHEKLMETRRRLNLTGTRILGFVYVRPRGWKASVKGRRLWQRSGAGSNRTPWPAVPPAPRRNVTARQPRATDGPPAAATPRATRRP
jgi:Mrp family chromosome partitioning ATPase